MSAAIDPPLYNANSVWIQMFKFKFSRPIAILFSVVCSSMRVEDVVTAWHTYIEVRRYYVLKSLRRMKMIVLLIRGEHGNGVS